MKLHPFLDPFAHLAFDRLGRSAGIDGDIDMFPDVEIPYITIITIYPGASPETVEREVSKRVEEAVNPISGVKHVGSISREGVSTVWVEFELEVDVAEAVQEARVKVTRDPRRAPR